MTTVSQTLLREVQRAWPGSTIAAGVVLIVLGLSAAVASATDDEAVPDGDEQLTIEELRWCSFESIRLDGVRHETDRSQPWEVDRANEEIAKYTEACASKWHYEQDMAVIRRELLATGKRSGLFDAGVERVMRARDDRVERRLYVNATEAEIRSEPGGGQPLASLGRWRELVATGRASGEWLEVEWPDTLSGRGTLSGWVRAELTERGDGEAARTARTEYCLMSAGHPPQNGELIRGGVTHATRHALKVDNGTDSDAYVKVVAGKDFVVVAFLAQSDSTAEVEGIPEGAFRVAFGTGSGFSRDQDRFCRRGRAFLFDKTIDYTGPGTVWSITLHNVPSGSATTTEVGYSFFDSL